MAQKVKFTKRLSVFNTILKFKKNNTLTRAQKELVDEEGKRVYSDYSGEYKIDVVAEVDPHLPYIRTTQRDYSSKRIKKHEKLSKKITSFEQKQANHKTSRRGKKNNDTPKTDR